MKIRVFADIHGNVPINQNPFSNIVEPTLHNVLSLFKATLKTLRKRQY